MSSILRVRPLSSIINQSAIIDALGPQPSILRVRPLSSIFH
jgi:hypothetical protein